MDGLMDGRIGRVSRRSGAGAKWSIGFGSKRDGAAKRSRRRLRGMVDNGGCGCRSAGVGGNAGSVEKIDDAVSFGVSSLESVHPSINSHLPGHPHLRRRPSHQNSAIRLSSRERRSKSIRTYILSLLEWLVDGRCRDWEGGCWQGKGERGLPTGLRSLKRKLAYRSRNFTHRAREPESPATRTDFCGG